MKCTAQQETEAIDGAQAFRVCGLPAAWRHKHWCGQFCEGHREALVHATPTPSAWRRLTFPTTIELNSNGGGLLVSDRRIPLKVSLSAWLETRLERQAPQK